MDEATRLRLIREARDAADAARRALMEQVEAALSEGIKVSAISHEARWSDTYVRSIARNRKEAGNGDAAA
jgi:hypothetical protein